jgi:hypothetical protein
MTAMLKSQRGLSDLSLLARSQLWVNPFASGRSRRPGTGQQIVDAGRLVVVRIRIDR